MSLDQIPIAVRAEVRDGSGEVVAIFPDRECALLCLPSMARSLRQVLFIRVAPRAKISFRNPLPHGCFVHDEDDTKRVVRVVSRP